METDKDEEEQRKDQKKSAHRHWSNHLKPHSTKAIEKAIADAIFHLTGGYAYTCGISKIEYGEGMNNRATHIDLKLIRNTGGDDDAVKTLGEAEYERQKKEKPKKGKGFVIGGPSRLISDGRFCTTL